MSPRPICVERDAKIWELYCQGLRYFVIAQQMGMNEKAVASVVNRHPDFPNHKPPQEQGRRRRVPQATIAARRNLRRLGDDPDQVAHLRAGINQFRAMLELRYPTPRDSYLERLAMVANDRARYDLHHTPQPAYESDRRVTANE